MELSLNTYSECVESFRAADQLMGSAFRQKLAAFRAALELAGPEPERGFQSQFARDCGCSRTYISYINKIASDPDLFSALNKHHSIGFDTWLDLSDCEPEIKTLALEQLEKTGELTCSDIEQLEHPDTVVVDRVELSEFEEAQIDREIERENLERERRLSEIERVVPTDDHIDRLVTLLISGGQQLETYCLRKNTVVQPEQFATFVANRLIDLSDHCGSDPEVYTSSLESIREFIRLVGSALDSVPAQRESHLKLVK